MHGFFLDTTTSRQGFYRDLPQFLNASVVIKLRWNGSAEFEQFKAGLQGSKHTIERLQKRSTLSNLQLRSVPPEVSQEGANEPKG